MEPTFAGGVSTQPATLDAVRKTQDVIAYHRDPDQEGRPVMLLLGGAAVALVCMVLIAALSFRAFYEHRITPDHAYFGISLLFCFYVLGVFLFAYAYELYDLPRALRLTLIAAFISLVFIVLVIVSLSTLAKMKDGVAAVAEQTESVSHNPLASTLVSYMGGTSAAEAEAAEAQRRRGGFEDFISPDARPFYVTCQGCGQVYTPVPPKAVCPYCGRVALPS
jgi:hypothetical protein